MKALVLTAVAGIYGFAMTGTAWGDSIPYPNAGTVASAPDLTAANAGTLELYFVGASASDTDLIDLCDTTTSTCTGYIFNNKTTAAGATDSLTVGAGDQLEVTLENLTTGQTFSSVSADSADGKNHIYATPYTATGTILGGAPVGTFIGGEDATDFDYNDVEFVFTNLSGGADATPEPASFALLGIGLAGLFAAKLRSKKSV